MAYITGFHGCKCHPFNSWKESDKAHNQKFKVGHPVKNRCTGIAGEIYEVCEEKGFYIVKYGNRPCDRHLEHAANIVSRVVQLSIFD